MAFYMGASYGPCISYRYLMFDNCGPLKIICFFVMKYVRILHYDGLNVLPIFWSQLIQFAFQNLIV